MIFKKKTTRIGGKNPFYINEVKKKFKKMFVYWVSVSQQVQCLKTGAQCLTTGAQFLTTGAQCLTTGARVWLVCVQRSDRPCSGLVWPLLYKVVSTTTAQYSITKLVKRCAFHLYFNNCTHY